MKKYLINFSLLYQNRNFGLVYIGQFVSFFGTLITGVAVPYQAYHLTHSILTVGILSLLQLIPLLFTALLGGVFADRYHRKLLLMITESLLALGCLALVINSFLSSIYLLFFISIFMSAVTGLHRPALDSLAQQLVDPKDYSEVSTLGSFKRNVSMIAGPAVGGVVIAAFGLVVTYFIDFLTFAFSLVTLLLMTEIPAPDRVAEGSTWSLLKSGFKHAFARQELLGTYIIDFVAMMFGMPMALFPAIAQAHGGASVLGLLYAAPAMGGLVVSLCSGWVKRVNRHGLAVALAAGCWGIAIVLFGLVKNIWIALFFLMLAGAFDAISVIFRSIMWNDIIPNEYRGRLASLAMISYLSGPKLGDTESGLIAASFGMSASIISGGVLCVFGVVIACFFLPKFIEYSQSPRNEAVDDGDLQLN